MSLETETARIRAEMARQKEQADNFRAAHQVPFAPTLHVIGKTDGKLLGAYEQMWASELTEATPSIANRHTVEHLAAVKADVERRRQEIYAKANEIASRSRS